jgi:hypothetical protein
MKIHTLEEKTGEEIIAPLKNPLEFDRIYI